MADDSARGPMQVLEPIEVAPDTWLLTQLLAGPMDAFPLPLSSLLVAGEQPVLVDTGAAAGGIRRLAAIASIVDPAAVRWIFLSHEDPDHAGNLPALLRLCPQATLVTSWLTVRRLGPTFAAPLERCRWVNDGESFDVGDRILTALTPPLFDAPSTIGVFDRRTGVYWAADAFGTTAQPWQPDAVDLNAAWREGFFAFHGLLAPWHELADARRFAASVHRLRRLGLSALTSAHGPVIRGPRVADALELMLQLPGRVRSPMPGQAQLERLARG
jgi:flavorubredoxin